MVQDVESPTAEVAAQPRQRRSPGPVVITVVAAGAGLVWAVAAVLCSDRGLDISDEGFYLLSYRWWNDNFDNFSGAQYVYGPVFELLGFDIARLRVVRLLLTLASHLWFGWAFMRWLRPQRPSAPASRWWESAGTATITASAGITYSWLPLSPGYNDLALTCSFVLAGGVLWIAKDNAIDRPPAAWVPIGMGATAVVMALGKWSSAMIVVLGLVALLVVLHVAARQGWRRLARLLCLGLVGVLLMSGFIQFALVPFQTILPPMLEVNSLVASSTNSPTFLLERYWAGGEILVGDIVDQHWPLLAAALVTPLLARWPRVAVPVVLLALGWSVAQVVRHNGTLAGPLNLPAFTVTIFAPLLALAVAGIALVVASPARRGTLRPRGPNVRPALMRGLVVTMLVILPVAQSVGTGNLLQYMAILGLGSWAAVAIALFTAERARSVAVRLLVGGCLTGIVAATTLIAVDGLWNRPYRTTGFAASTTVAEDVPALESIRLSPADAAFYSSLRQQLLPYVEEPGRAMMPFDGMAGLVYLLDGRPVGEPWYSGRDAVRSTKGVKRTCDSGKWWGKRRPIILFSRPITSLEIDALRHCGIHVRRYDRIEVTRHGAVIQIYVPPRGTP